MSTIRVMSGGAPKEVFAQLTPRFEAQSGHKIAFTYAVMSALRDKLLAGEPADILVMPVPLLENYAKEGIARGDARATLGTIDISVAVRKGRARPDLSSAESFKAALLGAKAIIHSRPGATPSGTHLGKLAADLGIAAELEKKTIHAPALEGGVERLVKGEADFGIYPTSEITNVKGLEVVGPLPAELQLVTIYGAAITVKAAEPDKAAGYIKFLTEPANWPTWKDAGFGPARA